MSTTPQPGMEPAESYRLLVEEYRFQVQLNWDRSKYLLGFNVAVVGLGTGLLQLGDPARELVAGIFVIGVLTCALAGQVGRVQHAYYQDTRDRMRHLADQLSLGAAAIGPTPGSQGVPRNTVAMRLGRVQVALNALLVVTGGLDLLGAVYTIAG